MISTLCSSSWWCPIHCYWHGTSSITPHCLWHQVDHVDLQLLRTPREASMRLNLWCRSTSTSFSYFVELSTPYLIILHLDINWFHWWFIQWFPSRSLKNWFCWIVDGAHWFVNCMWDEEISLAIACNEFQPGMLIGG